MAAEDIGRIDGRLMRQVEQTHTCFFGTPSALAVIARRARGYHVGPGVLAALVTGYHMIDGEPQFAAAAVLTCIIIAAEHFPTRQLHARARASHLVLEPDHRRSREKEGDGAKVPSTIGHHCGLSSKDEDYSAARCANVDGLEVRVEDQDGFVHGTIAILPIIA